MSNAIVMNRFTQTVRRSLVSVGFWWISALIVGFIALASTMAAVAPAANAATPTCYGNYCTGTNPYSTGCAANSYEWGYSDLTDLTTGAVVGDVQLWISRSCATRWARAQLWGNPTGNYTIQVQVHQSDGYTETTPYYLGDGTYYTRQIYNRSKCSYAAAWGQNLNEAWTGCTVW